MEDNHANRRDAKRRHKMIVRGRSIFTIEAVEHKREEIRKKALDTATRSR